MKRILIVEDDIFSIQPIKDHLEIIGHHVTIAQDALEAFSQFSSQGEYDILLIDVMVAASGIFTDSETADGRYTGLKLLEVAKLHSKNQAVRNAKVALITNWREEPQIDKIASKYDVTVFRKPLSLEQIEIFVK